MEETDEESPAICEEITRRTGLPCVDPLKDGLVPIVERLNKEFPPCFLTGLRE